MSVIKWVRKQEKKLERMFSDAPLTLDELKKISVQNNQTTDSVQHNTINPKYELPPLSLLNQPSKKNKEMDVLPGLSKWKDDH